MVKEICLDGNVLLSDFIIYFTSRLYARVKISMMNDSNLKCVNTNILCVAGPDNTFGQMWFQ